MREFENAPSGDWRIVLDLDRGVQVGGGQDATHEHGIILAASLTDLGMRFGRAVGLAAYGDALVWHRSRLSDEHKWEILRSLALVEPGDVSLAELLELVRPSADRKTSLIIITPAVDGAWLPALLALRRLGVISTVLLFDTATFGAAGGCSGLADDLAALGITTQMIPRELLERGESQMAEARDWGWRDSVDGRLVPSTAREEFAWRELG